jgi:hypothetical protein
MNRKSKSSGAFLTVAARIALVIALIGSVALTILASHGNRSTILILLFVGWVALPFVGLGFVDLLSSEWSVSARTTLFWLMLFVAVASPAIYGYVVTHPRPQQAFPFLVTPFSTWALMVIVFLAFQWRARSRTQR